MSDLLPACRLVGWLFVGVDGLSALRTTDYIAVGDHYAE